MKQGGDAQVGDALASGATRKSFPPAGGRVSQQRWNEIFGESDEKKEEKKEEVKESEPEKS